jgi:hypothetical protein
MIININWKGKPLKLPEMIQRIHNLMMGDDI